MIKEGQCDYFFAEKAVYIQEIEKVFTPEIKNIAQFYNNNEFGELLTKR